MCGAAGFVPGSSGSLLLPWEQPPWASVSRESLAPTAGPGLTLCRGVSCAVWAQPAADLRWLPLASAPACVPDRLLLPGESGAGDTYSFCLRAVSAGLGSLYSRV